MRDPTVEDMRPDCLSSRTGLCLDINIIMINNYLTIILVMKLNYYPTICPLPQSSWINL